MKYPRFTTTMEGFRLWTLVLIEDRDTDPGAPVALESDLSRTGTWTLEYGDMGTANPRGERVLPSDLLVDVRDPGGLLGAALDGAEEEAWTAVLTGADLNGDGGYEWRGNVRLGKVRRPLWREAVGDLRQLALYDGLGGDGKMGGATRTALVTTDPDAIPTLHEQVTASTGAERLGAGVRYALPLTFRVPDFPGGADVGTPALAHARVTPLVYAPVTADAEAEVIDAFVDRDGKPIAAAEQLREIAVLTGARAWQAISPHDGGAAASAFCLASPRALGVTVPDDFAGEGDTAEAWDYGEPLEIEALTGDAPSDEGDEDVPGRWQINRNPRGRLPGAIIPNPAFANYPSPPGVYYGWFWSFVGTFPSDEGAGAEGGQLVKFFADTHGYTSGPMVPKGVVLDGYLRALAHNTVDASGPGRTVPLLTAALEIVPEDPPVPGLTWWLSTDVVQDPADATNIILRPVWFASIGVPPVTFVDWLANPNVYTMRYELYASDRDPVDATALTELRSMEALNLGPATPAAGLLRLHVWGSDWEPVLDSAELVLNGALPIAHPGDAVDAAPVIEEPIGWHAVGERRLEGRTGGAADWRPVSPVLDAVTTASYADPLRLSARLAYEDFAVGPDDTADLSVLATFDGLMPPERAAVIDAHAERVWRVGSGCALDLMRERTAAVLVPQTTRYEA